jgi:hypothetical protein
MFVPKAFFIMIMMAPHGPIRIMRGFLFRGAGTATPFWAGTVTPFWAETVTPF